MNNLDLYLNLASYLVALGGLGSLALTGEIPIPLLSFAFLSLFLSFFYLHPTLLLKGEEKEGGKIRSKIWDKLALLIFILYILDFSVASSFFMATVHLLILLQILKLFTLREDKDYLYLYLLSFSQLLAASVLNINLSYFWSLLFFLVTIIWALLLHHLKNFPHPNPLPGGEGKGGESGLEYPLSTFFLVSSSIAMLAFVLTLALFFMIPHVELGLSKKGLGRSVHLSGFSEKVDLGGLGPIKLDSTVVMRVKMSEQRNMRVFYWRGAAFDYFDGFSWHRTFPQKRPLFRDSEGNFRVNKMKGNGKLLRQEFFLEPIDSRIIFIVPKTVRIMGSFPYLLKDPLDALYLVHPSLVPISYTVYSAAEANNPNVGAGLRARPLGRPETAVPTNFIPTVLSAKDFSQGTQQPIFDKSIYLRMPAMAQDISRLTEQITRGLSHPHEKIQAIENFLKGNFQYDLEVERDYRFRPIEDFLFNRKAGYCEHFATAMVLMLRSVGIPARLVTGFLHGEWNEFGKYYLIRQKDAHSWVEAYSPSMGWITLDPTPPTQYEVLNSPLFLEYFSRYIDSLRLKWHKYILCYSLEDQIRWIYDVRTQIYSMEGNLINLSLWIKGFIQGLLQKCHAELVSPSLETLKSKTLTLNLIQGIQGKVQGDFSMPPLIIFLILLLIFIVPLVTLWALRGRQAHSPTLRLALYQHRPVKRVKFYEQMLKILERKGFFRRLGITPLEFAQQIMRIRGNDFYGVMEITSAYNKIRFGGEILSPMEKERIWRIVRDLKRM